MGIRKKNIITMLCIIIFNVIVIIAYYQFFLSDTLTNIFNQNYENLQKQTQNFANLIEDLEIEDAVESFPNNTNQKIILSNAKGEILFESLATMQGDSVIDSEKIIQKGENVYLLKVSTTINLEKLQRKEIVSKLVKMEIILIMIELIILGIFTQIEYLNPIISIQESMKRYKDGIKPKRSKRCDEFGYLQNTFVDITQNLEIEKQKQNRIIASISHDVKTPLTSIMGYSERLKKGVVEEQKKKRYIDVIYTKAQNIKELVEEFDEYLGYKLKANLHRQPIQVKELLEIIQADYKEELESENIILQFEDSCENAILNVDISKLRRVFANAIGNSVKHFKEGEKEIRIRVSKKGKVVCFEIMDNGTGVKQEELTHIFETLYTSDQGRKVAGLGLSISKDIIESHEGKIWAKNNEM